MSAELPGGARAVVVTASNRAAAGFYEDRSGQVLAEGLRALGFDTGASETPIIPVLIGDQFQAARFWRALFDAGVFVNVALHPAVPPGGALLRTSVMATHTREHLDRALAIFAEVRDEAAGMNSGPTVDRTAGFAG